MLQVLFEKPKKKLVNRYALEAALCRESFYDFFLRFWGEVVPETLVPNWHIKYLCDELQVMAERVFKREPKKYDLIINISPGSTKSTICSVMFPAWCWLRDQTMRMICGSYGYGLSLDLSNRCRRVLTCDKFKKLFPELVLVSEGKELIETDRGGQRIATSTGAANITGKHAHLLIVDDPLNPQEALSEAELKSCIEWFDQTLLSRCIDRNVTPLILVMQRLHQADPTGHLLEKNSDIPYRRICLPAEDAYPVFPRILKKHYVDGLFDPVRLPRKLLMGIHSVSDYAYAGQYGQQPVPLGGGMFRTEKIEIGTPEKMVRVVRAWDKAGCLLAGTRIRTENGEKLIEDVQAGDWVHTRNGLEEVDWAGPVKPADDIVSVLFSNGEILTGTKDHPVWTVNRGWVELATVGSFDTVQTWDTAQELLAPDMITSFSGIQDTAVLNPHVLERNGSRGSGTLKPLMGGLCIAPCGWHTTGAFPLATISTTRTKTMMTIQSRILNVLPGANTCSNTGRNSGHQHIVKFCAEFVEKLLKGPSGFGPNGKLYSTFVLSVGFRSLVEPLTQKGSSIVHLSVMNECDVEPIPVYDLTVRNQHEFYANNLLVHNTGNGKGCFTVGTLMGRDFDGRYWVLDVVRGQWEASERERIIKQTAVMDGRFVQIIVEQEGGSGGKESATATVRNLAGFRVRVDIPRGDKAMRADPFATQVNAGNVRLKKGIWNSEFLKELQFFPFGKYKDQVDSTSMGFAALTMNRTVGGLGAYEKYTDKPNRLKMSAALPG